MARSGHGAPRRRWRAPAALAVVVMAVASVLATGAGPASAQAVPQDIPELARINGKTADQIRQILADATARVDATGHIFFVERQPPAPSASATPQAGPYPYAQTFTLHSRPGSQRTIYLDFNGETISNTAWNGTYGAPAGSYYAEPFSIDANGATFSNAEQDVVQSVWQRVSEDYATFDVDVTTQDPGAAAIDRSGTGDQVYGTRALVTDATEIADTCGCGGIAYIGTFDDAATHARYQPAFVFAPAQFDDAKNIGEAVSHEVGHNLGLHHDGTSSTEYYEGQGSWAPIMGGSYSRPITQWSRGEYSGANNTELDLDVMVANGAPLLGDDHGNTTAAATALGSGPSVGATGLITTDADVDVFKVDAMAGSATFSATPAPVSPDLDIQLQLRNGAGSVLVTSNPASATVSVDVASGLSASISTTLATAGSYYLFVSGVGAGSPAATGYSGYASIGRYSLSGTVASGPTPTLSIDNAPAVNEGPSGVDTTATFTITLSAAAASTVTVVASTANGTATAGSDYTSASSTVSFSPGTTSRPFPVTVIGDATVEPTETFNVNLTGPSGATLADGQGVGTITNDDSAGPANDNLAAATTVSGLNGTVNGTSTAATKEPGEPNHAGVVGGRSVWFRWTAQDAGSVTFDTFGSGFDTVLGIYTGTAVNALTGVANNNDSGGPQSKATFTASKGATYQVAVDGVGAASGAVKLSWVQVPPNNSFAAAAVPAGANGTMSGTNVGADKEAGEPNHAGVVGGKSVWYRWNAPGAGAVTFDTFGSTFDTVLAVYTGNVVNGLTLVAGNNDSGGPQSKVSFSAAAGATYRLAVDGNGGASGAVTVHWLQNNNNFLAATNLTGASGTVTGSNVGATKETGEPDHAGFAGGTSVWFRWTAPTTGTKSFDTFGSSFDTLLGVYTGTAVNGLTVVASNDDTGGGQQSKVTFPVTAGVTYRIAVDGYGASTGTVKLNWA
jgi:hypothetical protein